jgi:Na+-transporting methylmalonyl-CoA/oxaloacetate decarboxylase gamma subunit
MSVAIVLSVILVLICAVRAIDSLDPKRDSFLDFLSVLGIAIFSILLGVLVTTYVYKEEAEMASKRQPTAIDVYKGKTALRVTYIDSIATDSVVVFKGK